jgi:hypothetical protein
MSARRFPGSWQVEAIEGGHLVVKDATGFSVYARREETRLTRLFAMTPYNQSVRAS